MSFYKPLFKELLDHITEVWSSPPNVENFQSLGLDPSKFIPFDYGAVNTDKFSNMKEGKNYTLNPDDTIIGSFRRLRGELVKPSVEAFLESLKLLNEKRDDYHAIIGGIYSDRDKSIEDLINKRISRMNLEKSVTLLDMVPKEEMPYYYSGLDVYVNLTHKGISHNGIGTSSKEAMASECAYITYNDPPKDYIIQNGKNGYTVPHDDPGQLFSYLDELCSSENLVREFGKKARETVINNYSHTAIQNKVMSRIRDIVK
jgi:glycosyltransferase involved in cell wall biosynthesis